MSTMQPLSSAIVPPRVGHYHIKRLIGGGGMGIVYEAAQENPRRTVAVKVLKHGIASRSALRRFEYEAQLLARLHHPGIAQIYEAGTYDDGSGVVPYFAMEYIPAAKAITAYAQEKGLGTRARLELMAKVCDAVHHGHQKGIIHRDLKPGNILVDAQGDVKIIDFGVARGTDSDMVVTTLQTDIGQLVGTLQYMSPEQCAADPHDLDVRSDVYALGVVLYELLSGKLPYEVRGKPAFEGTRIIREQEPMRLCMADRALGGDVETIATKALEKDRERRYQSAIELAQDIRRYLANEAIMARPPSIAYQFRMFARRHRAPFIAAAVVALAVLAGTGVSTWEAVRATRAERTVTKLLDQTEEARNQAEHSASVARSANTFVSELLKEVAPAQGGHRTSREILDDASRRIDSKFDQEPLAKALIHSTLANTYWELGEYEVARHHAEQAVSLRRAELGVENRETLDSMNTLAVLYRYLGRDEEAERLHTETLRLRRSVLGDEHPDTLESMCNLAVVLRILGRIDEGEALQREALAIRRRTLGMDNRDTLLSMANLAKLLSEKGELDEAAALAGEALSRRTRVLGEQHPDTLQSMNSMAAILDSQGKLEEAEALYRRLLPLARHVLGDQHIHLASPLQGLAKHLCREGKDEEAAPLLVEAIHIRQKTPLFEVDATTSVMVELGRCWTRLQQFEKAEEILREAWTCLGELKTKAKPLAREDVARAFAELYDTWGRPDQAGWWRGQLSVSDAPAHSTGADN